jgi:hypothetical protein
MSDKPDGYRDLTDLELGAINDIKAMENRVGDLVSTLRDPDTGLTIDPRRAARAVTHFETGFMFLVKAVAKPDSRLK